MIYKNRHCRRSKISEAKFRQIVHHFALDLTATAVRCIDWYFTALYQHHLSAYAGTHGAVVCSPLPSWRWA